MLIVLDPSRAMTIAELRKLMNVSYDDMDRRIGHLELCGFVQRARQSRVRLTHSGCEAAKRYKDSGPPIDGGTSP
ncbi:hypothetical protein KIPE111705_07215 [Kibdelosporangium persicum]